MLWTPDNDQQRSFSHKDRCCTVMWRKCGENGEQETEGNKAGNMTVEMALFVVLEVHPLPRVFKRPAKCFMTWRMCLYGTSYVLLNQFVRSSGSWLFYCHVIATAMSIGGSSLCTEAACVSFVVVGMTALEASQSQPGVVFCSRCNWPMSTSPKYLMPAKSITWLSLSTFCKMPKRLEGMWGKYVGGRSVRDLRECGGNRSVGLPSVALL